MRAAADLIGRVRAVLGAQGDAIAAAYLFGSVARGTATATSDIDVAVLFTAEPSGTLAGLHLDLEAEIERAVGTPVQLVVLNRAPVDLVHRVLRDGVLVLDRDPSRRIRFEVRARNAYFDLKPHVDRYRRVSPAARH
jgi:predicted nucleotidyltransferase